MTNVAAEITPAASRKFIRATATTYGLRDARDRTIVVAR